MKETEDIESPFIIKKRKKSTAGGARKKQKSDNTSNIESMVLVEGEIDDIRDALRDITIDM